MNKPISDQLGTTGSGAFSAVVGLNQLSDVQRTVAGAVKFVEGMSSSISQTCGDALARADKVCGKYVGSRSSVSASLKSRAQNMWQEISSAAHAVVQGMPGQLAPARAVQRGGRQGRV